MPWPSATDIGLDSFPPSATINLYPPDAYPWLSSHKERNGDQGRRDPGFFRSWAASCNSFLERVETNQQRPRVAADPIAPSDPHRQPPKFHRNPWALLAESTRHRQTERPHADFPLPAPPSIHPPSPSQPRSLETHESTRTTRLQAIAQARRKGTEDLRFFR